MDAQHFHPSPGQELLDSPVIARPPQQPPKAPRRMLPPPYSAAPHPHCQSIARESHRQTRGCSRPEAGNQDQSQSAHPESSLLHLLANSSPIRSPEELLARLKAAGTAAATPTAAHMDAQRDSDRLIGHIPTDDAMRRQHEEALLASTELHQSLFATAMSASPPSRGQCSWAPVIQQNMPGWQQQRGTHVWDPPDAGYSQHGLQMHRGCTRVHSHTGSHGSVGSAATVPQAGKVLHENRTHQAR
ncbi:hypothetical protein ABBQ32_006020 [Trebouxia sp. C0010 RCD-2024]